MSIWDWFHEEMGAILDGDDAELREMAIATIDGFEPRYAEVERRLADLARARAIAQRRGMGWWVGFLDHWRLQILLHESRDYVAGLDLAVRASVEARKPSCQGLPQRVCLHEDLVTAYATIDPLGYESQVRDALAYMRAQVGPEAECHHCILGLEADFEFDLGNLQTALERNNESGALAASEQVPHHLAGAYARLCRLYHRAGQVDDTFLEWASAGADAARAAENEPEVAVCEMWKAVALRRLGREDEARRARQTAMQVRARLTAQPGATFYDAVAGYHAAGGELPQALEAREEEARGLAGTGRLFPEAENRLHQVGLRAAMGTLSPEDVGAAVEAISRLKRPEPLLDALRGILGGDEDADGGGDETEG